ncbi:MAG: hypothetical protein HYX71_06270 [Opitutae bacterium]|nr:hypothetical protein [Opitutae bacterium]
MNKKSTLLTLALVAGTAGLAAFGLSNTEFAARFPLDTFLAAATTLGLVHLALADYSRRVKPLRLPAAVLRPAPRRVVRVSACVERVAA